MKITRDHVSQPQAIVALAEKYSDLFMDYPEARPARAFDPYRDTYDQQDDRYHVLRMGYNMPGDLADVIGRALNLSKADRASDIRINRYDPGDYLQPRLDERDKGIIVLTSSASDGLTIADREGAFIKVPDRAGTYVIADRGTWHWVDPVREGARYTIVTDPPIHGPPPVRRAAERRRGGDRRRTSGDARPPTTEAIGRGATAVIYATDDPERVLKTCWQSDSYAMFLKFVRRQPSRHLPVIHRQAANPDGRQWVEMERLRPLLEGDAQWPVINAFCAYCHAVGDRRPTEADPLLSVELVALAQSLGDFARQWGLSLDLASTNIMIRPETGEIVVVDPFW